MIKFHSAIVATALSVVLIPACGKKSADNSAGNQITIWWAQWDPAVGLQELGDEFEKETGIKVNVHQIPWPNYQDQVFINFGNSSTDFDVVVGDSQWIGRGATKGLYLQLTDWLPTAVDMKGLHPVASKYLCEYPAGSGKLWAAPCETDAVGFAYRKDLFENPSEKASFRKKFGKDLRVPQTWDEFAQVAEFFTRPPDKTYGCALLTGRGYDCVVMGFQNFLWAFGGSWADPSSGKVAGALDSEAAASSLAFMKSLLKFTPPGGANLDYGPSLEAFTNGSAAMMMNYFAFFPGIAKTLGDKAGFFPVPAKDGRRFASLGGQGFSISTKVSKDQQNLAKQFIAWFLKTENQKKWITKPAGFTANLEILRSAEFRKAAAYNGPFADSLDHVQDFSNAPVYNELLGSARSNLGEALDGVKSPAQALAAIAADHDRVLNDAGLVH